jgi:undecaprenyl-diphosphatase
LFYLKYWLLLWAFGVAYSRIYNGVHYPGDVLAGACIGILFGFLMAKAYFRTNDYLEKRGKLDTQTNI